MIKDIVVHLDGTSNDEARLAHAEAMAGAFEAHLTGLFTNLVEIGYIAADPVGASVEIVADAVEEARLAGDSAERALRARIANLSCKHDFRRFDGTDGELREHAATLARMADLFIAGRPLGGEDQGWPSLFQSALFSGGRGVYVVPPGAAVRPLRTVVIGWRDSRETTRAVTEAMPFLRAATRVVLATVGGEADAQAGIAAHLLRHGIAAESRLLPMGGKVSERLLRECAAVEADLLVIGAYGHSRFWEWVLGGTTRNVLTVSDVPVLMAH